MGNDTLLPQPQPTSLWTTLKQKGYVGGFLILLVSLLLISTVIFSIYDIETTQDSYEENYVPDITVPSMDFTVLNMTETRLSVRWDLLIRIPPDLPGFYMCLDGDFQVFIIYKGVTIATSSIESYSLRPWWANLLKVSSIASEVDMDGVIVKDIMESIKERSEMRFGSRLHFQDCRYETTGKMNYACDDAVLQFEPGSHRTASLLFGNHSTCSLVV